MFVKQRRNGKRKKEKKTSDAQADSPAPLGQTDAQLYPKPKTADLCKAAHPCFIAQHDVIWHGTSL